MINHLEIYNACLFIEKENYLDNIEKQVNEKNVESTTNIQNDLFHHLFRTLLYFCLVLQSFTEYSLCRTIDLCLNC